MSGVEYSANSLRVFYSTVSLSDVEYSANSLRVFYTTVNLSGVEYVQCKFIESFLQYRKLE